MFRVAMAVNHTVLLLTEANMTETDYIGLTKPTIGSVDWGADVNANFDLIDQLIAEAVGHGINAIDTGKSDSFPGPTLNVKWTQYNGTYLSSSFLLGGIRLVATAAQNGICGIYQAVPAGDFSIVSALNFGAGHGDASVGGIMLMEGLTASDNKVVFGYESDYFDGFRFPNFVDDTTWNTGNYWYGGQNWDVLKFERVSTTWNFYGSKSGKAWALMDSLSQPWAPTHIGLGMFIANASTYGGQLFSDWFIVT